MNQAGRIFSIYFELEKLVQLILINGA